MKKNIRLTVAILIVLATVFSLTSCLTAISTILNPTDASANDKANDNTDQEDDSGNKQNDGDQDSLNNGGGLNNNNNSGNTDSDDADDNGSAEYYPGSTGGDTDVVKPSKAVLSIVSIISNFKLSHNRVQPSAGSGVIYQLDKEKGDAYIITNYHVIYNRYAATSGGICDDIDLYLYGMELDAYKISATYVGGSLTQDLALLKVEGSEVLKNSNARAADVGNSDAVTIMDQVLVIGNPEGYGISVTKGIVSVDSENLEMIGADSQTQLSLRVVRFDAAVNEGNSGGGLFDENGNLIGIINAKRTGTDVDNIAYAIPTAYAINFIENIRYYCDGAENITPYKCLLGVTVTAAVSGVIPDNETGDLTIYETVEVSKFTANSAFRGKLKVGDRLVSVTVDGVKKDITRIHHLIDHVLLARVGSEITIEATRNGEPITVTVTVPESALTLVK